MEQNGAAVREVATLAQQAMQADRHTVEIDGRQYSTKNLHLIEEPAENWPEALVVHGLSGILDYIQTNPDGVATTKLVVHVRNPAEVALIGVVQGDPHRRTRFAYVTAKAIDRTEGLFGFYKPVSELVVAIQTRFQDAADRAEVLRLLGNVKDEQLTTQQDDGVSQEVSVRAGVSLVEMERVPNPVMLRPFRTFPEIEEQPASPFVLRLRKGHGGGVEAALFEADGGAWKQQALDEISAWFGSFDDELGGVNIIS